jgi:hypothetical protein
VIRPPARARLTPAEYFFRALAILSFVLYAIAIYDNLLHGFTTGVGNNGNRFYALFVLTPSVLLAAALIVWRTPGNSVGRYLLLIGLGALGWQFSYDVGPPQLSLVLKILFLIFWYGLAFPSLIYLMLSFPTGRVYPPRWARWVLVFAIVKFVGVVLEFSSGSDLIAQLLGQEALNALLFAPLHPFSTLISVTIGSNGLLFALGAIAGVTSLVLRYRVSISAERQQIKWVVWSFAILSAVAALYAVFTLVGGMASPFLGDLAGAIFLTALLIIIISLGISILRYRLFDIDLLINRTLVYLPLTALLAGVFAACISVSQRLFVTLTGQTSDAAIAFTTLVVVAVFDPLKTWLHSLVDRRFKEAPDPRKRLGAYNEQLQTVLQVFDPTQTAKKFLDEAIAAFDAEGGAVRLNRSGRSELLCNSEKWDGHTQMIVPFQRDGELIGEIDLGKRRNGADYTSQDREMLEKCIALIVSAFIIAQIVDHRDVIQGPA